MGLLNKFAVQLYSVRHETAKDFAGTVRRVARIGYSGVEFAGYGGLNAAKMKKLLDECGLEAVGSHVGMEELENNLGAVLEYNASVGTEYIVLPWAEMKNRDDALRLAEKCEKIGAKCVKAGFKFAYHNHAGEFAKDNGEYLMDIFYSHTNPLNVRAELDLYWIAYAGVDALAYLQKYAGRADMLHLKQIRDYTSKQCVDLDEGVIDFKTIIETGNAAGTKHYILEQEEFEFDAFRSLEKGYKHIMSL